MVTFPNRVIRVRSGRDRVLRISLIVALLGLVSTVNAVPANAVATTIYVDSTTGNDSTGDGTVGNPYQTFHKGYTAAVAGDTINLNGTFTWTDAGETGDTAGSGYTLSKNLTIVGQGRTNTIVQAASTRNTADRMVFFVGANVTVTFRDLTIRHGKVVSAYQGGGVTLAGQYCGNYPCSSITGTATLERVDVVMNDAPVSGTTMYRAGGIYMREASTLTLNDVNVAENTCTCYLYSAGGIAGGEQSQNLTISNSSIYDNSASSSSGSTWPLDYSSVAGGIAMQRSGQFKMSNSTVYGNSTNHYAGGINLYSQYRATLTNVTIVNNTATLGAGGILWNTVGSGAIYTLYLKNVLLANNTGASTANDFYAKDANAASNVVAPYSIVENSTNKTFSDTGVITGEQSSLGLAAGLALNGSSRGTPTLAVGVSSVAVDGGNSAAHGVTGYTVTPPTSDQRGTARSGAPDIGAFEAGTNAPPTLSSSTPADNATGVGIATNIGLTFSDTVTAVSGKNIVLKKSADNSTVQTFSATGSRVSVSGSTVTIDPTDELDYSTGYYLVVDAGAFINAGGFAYAGISSSTALNFTTGADTTAPTLASSNPADNATNVALSASISLVFSENVIAVSGKNIMLKKTSDNSTVQTFSVTGSGVTVSGATVTVNPTSNLSYSTAYYLLIDSGAFKDASNNVYAGISSSTALNFTSAADTADPTLISTTPADNATGVATAANIILEFSENISAVSGKDVVIKKSLDNSTFESISVTNGARVSISADTVTINPTNPFESGVGYFVLIDAGAFRDSAGNGFAGIASSTALNFTVIGSATTSTSTPISTSSNLSTTIAPSTTVANATSSGETQSTATTVVSGGARTAATTTSSTTSTTVAVNEADLAPDAPDAEPGTATAFINGVEVPMTITRVNNNLQISSANLRLEIGIYDESGQIVPLDADGNAVVNEGSEIAYSVVGAQPGASLEAWLFSDPFKLGTVVVGDDGRAEGRLPVSVEVPAGSHRLVMKTLTGGGEEATVAIGVVSGASGSPATVGRIIFVSLLAAIAVGLIIPATRRRRRKQAAAV